MAVSQNICYQVVTIGWLKNFIGTKLQNSNGGTVYVGGSYDDSYCPTYSQLTNGTLLPYRSASSSGPASDTDGITVNSICHATSQSYSSNQLVNIHDMAVCNTRLDSFTVSVDTSTISGCNGGTRNLSYTRRFTRTTWDMLNCSNQSTPRETSTSVNDTRNNLVSWDTNRGSIVDSSSAGSGKAVSIGKNTPPSTAGSSYRTLTITGSSTFRGSTSTDTTSVGQNGVGGEYKYWYTTQVGQTNYRVTCSGGPSFGCEGGSYSAAAKHDYKDRYVSRWQDECGVNYDSWTTYSDSSTYTATDYTYSGSFPDISSAGGSNSDSWSKSGYAGSCSWSQSCSSPSTTYTYGTGTTSAEGPCAGGSVSLYSDNIPYTATTTYGDGSTASTTGYTAGTASVTIDGCNDSCTKTGTVSATHGSISYTITQSNCDIQCPTDSSAYGLLYDGVVQSGAETGSELGYTLNNTAFTSYSFSTPGYTGMTNVRYNGQYHASDYPIFAADFAANTSTDDRTFTIYLDASNSAGQTCRYYINITQRGKAPCTCTLSKDSITLSSTAETTEYVGITANCNVTVEASGCQGDWIHPVYESSNNRIKLEIEGNQTSSQRSCSVIVKVDGENCGTISVTQPAGGGCTAGTYHYILHVPQIPQPGVITGPYDIYLCRTRPIANYLEAQSLVTGGTKLEKVSTYYNVCDFEVDGSGNFVRLIGATDLINFVPTGGGDVTTTDFEVNKGYYICAVQTDDPTKFYPFTTQADLKTQDVTCADYTQEITN